MCVSRKFQRCLRVFQGYVDEVLRVFHGNFKGVLSVVEVD